MGSFQEETGSINPYHIQISPEAQRGLQAISRGNRRLIIDAIDGLAGNPRPDNSKLLRKAENLRRLTVGDYRVIYGIQESTSSVTVELAPSQRRLHIVRSTRDSYPSKALFPVSVSCRNQTGPLPGIASVAAKWTDLRMGRPRASCKGCAISLYNPRHLTYKGWLYSIN